MRTIQIIEINGLLPPEFANSPLPKVSCTPRGILHNVPPFFTNRELFYIHTRFFFRYRYQPYEFRNQASQHINYVITLQLTDYKILVYLDLRKIMFSPLPLVRFQPDGSRNPAAEDTASSILDVIRYTHYFQFAHSSRMSIAHVSNANFFSDYSKCVGQRLLVHSFFLFVGGRGGQPQVGSATSLRWVSHKIFYLAAFFVFMYVGGGGQIVLNLIVSFAPFRNFCGSIYNERRIIETLVDGSLLMNRGSV